MVTFERCVRLEQVLTGRQLNNPDLLRNLSFVNGEWKSSKSGKTFEVVGELAVKW
jgi:hypothetical protein